MTINKTISMIMVTYRTSSEIITIFNNHNATMKTTITGMAYHKITE